jgi:outer membrane protein assembly factor BamB
VNGKIYITGDVGDELHLFCLNQADGKLLWTAKGGRSWKDPYPGARSTPTYSAGRIYLQNAHGEIRAFDSLTGKPSWTINLLERFAGNNITWGLSECLLVDDRALYATAGGREALVVALDKTTGDQLWKSDPLFDSQGDKSLENASYVSPILIQFTGRRLLIGCSLRHLYCIDADSGAIQWTRRIPTAYSVIAMMPVLVGNAIFMTAPHGKPGALFQLLAPREEGGKIRFEEKWETKLDTCQGGVVYHDGKLVGSFYPGRKGWAAVKAATGEVLYQAEDIVKGAVLYADDRFYILSENGWMHLLEAAPDKFIVHGKFRLASADNNAWAHPVVLEKRLYLRYQQELFCYDIAAP